MLYIELPTTYKSTVSCKVGSECVINIGQFLISSDCSTIPDMEFDILMNGQTSPYPKNIPLLKTITSNSINLSFFAT